MSTQIPFQSGVTLAGAGPFDAEDLRAARALAPRIVAADGGADRLAALGARPELVIGDMDSLARAVPEGARLIPVAEQDTTDFGKCLARLSAPLIVGIGFLGGRLDHTLAALSVLLEHAEARVVLLGGEDVAYIAPPGRAVTVEPGARVSFFPLLPCRGVASEGLRWPVEGLAMAAGGVIGTSNEAIAARIGARFEPPGVVTILPRRCLEAVARSLGEPSPDRPAGQ